MFAAAKTMTISVGRAKGFRTLSKEASLSHRHQSKGIEAFIQPSWLISRFIRKCRQSTFYSLFATSFTKNEGCLVMKVDVFDTSFGWVRSPSFGPPYIKSNSGAGVGCQHRMIRPSEHRTCAWPTEIIELALLPLDDAYRLLWMIQGTQ